MTAREAAHRYSAMGKRAAVGFATTLLHHWLGHDPKPPEAQKQSSRGGGPQLTRLSCL